MIIIGIAGGTGSGKTTVVQKIEEKFPKNSITIIPQDAYYKDSSHIPLEERQKINFDHPQSIEWELLIQHVKDIKEAKSIERPIYSYITCTRSKETIKIEPSKVVIIEGIMILCNEELRNLMDLKIFVNADADDRLARVIRRDIVERGRDVLTVLKRYDDTVKPSHNQFIEPTMRYADIIIPQGGNNKVAIDLLIKFLRQNMNHG